MSRARRTIVLLTAALCFVVTGCNSLDSVSKFCTASNTTLTSAVPVFKDFEDSCNRTENVQKGIGNFAIADPPDAGCVAIGKQATAAIAAVNVLSAYFTALNSIAAYGAKNSTDAKTLATNVTAAAGVGKNAQAALGSIALFLDQAVEGAYEQKALGQDISETSKHVGTVTDALVTIVKENYLNQLLDDEEGNYQDTYTEFKQKYTANNTDGTVLLMLDDRWTAEQKSLADKRAAAQCLITALNAIKTGSASLAENANKLKAKEIPAILSPYITQLQTLIPQIQKAF